MDNWVRQPARIEANSSVGGCGCCLQQVSDSLQVYLNFAARENAADYLDAKECKPETANGAGENSKAPEVDGELEEAQSGGRGQSDFAAEAVNSKAKQHGGNTGSEGERAKKRKKLIAATPLVEADIDWNSGGLTSRQPDSTDAARDEEGQGVAMDLVAALGPRMSASEGAGSAERGVGKARVQSAHTTDLEQATIQSQHQSRDEDPGGLAERRHSGDTHPLTAGGGSSWLRDDGGRPSAEGLMDYSPTRHGGDSPPRRDPSARVRGPPCLIHCSFH
jgi:hypothetical protein